MKARETYDDKQTDQITITEAKEDVSFDSEFRNKWPED